MASVRPLSTSIAVLLPARSNMATSVPSACVPPLSETSGSSVDEAKRPPASTDKRLTGTVRLVSVVRSRGPARLTLEPDATIIAESNVAEPPVYSISGSRPARVSVFPPWIR